MKKALKILGIVTVILVALIAYNGWRNMKKLKAAQKQADYIMLNLDNPNIYEKFPSKYFPKEQLEPILGGIRENCDWKNRDGKFVDFFTQKNIGGIDIDSYIYEYYLKCDSLRFILSFNVENEPELIGFKFEPIESQNPMILFPEKQLKR